MPRIEPFEKYHARYEEWFVRHKFAYESELNSIKMLIPEEGTGLEIGVGTGLFAGPLGIKEGVEPSKSMRKIASKRGISVIAGIGEALPYKDDYFDFAVIVTTICFLDNVERSLEETYRVLKPGGSVLIGFVDRNSPLGQSYQKHKEESVFYQLATFYSVDEVVDCLRKVGFRDFAFTQTIFNSLNEISEIEPVKEGYGKGSFVVVRGMKLRNE